MVDGNKSGDLSQQLNLAKELNNVLREQSKLLDKISSNVSSQAKMFDDIKKAAKGQVNTFKGQTDSVKALSQSINEAKDASRGFTDELKKGLRDAKEEAGGLTGAFKGVKNFMFSWKGGVLAILGGYCIGFI